MRAGGWQINAENFQILPRIIPIFTARRAINFEFAGEMTPAALGTNP